MSESSTFLGLSYHVQLCAYVAASFDSNGSHFIAEILIQNLQLSANCLQLNQSIVGKTLASIIIYNHYFFSVIVSHCLHVRPAVLVQGRESPGTPNKITPAANFRTFLLPARICMMPRKNAGTGTWSFDIMHSWSCYIALSYLLHAWNWTKKIKTEWAKHHSRKVRSVSKGNLDCLTMLHWAKHET